MTSTLFVGLAATLMTCCVVSSTKNHSNQSVEMLKQLPGINPAIFRSEPYIRAAAKLQSLPKTQAVAILTTVANDLKHDDQIIVLCRMLFVAKPGREFRKPRLGTPDYFNGTEDAQWPLSPIELVDGVPFLICAGHRLAGIREPAGAYLAYCVKTCNWSKYEFAPTSQQQRLRALEKLFASSKWKGPFDEPETEFLESQVK